MKLNYAIKFVADMDRAAKFYRDVLGLPLKFQSPGWSEFETGDTILALHPGSEWGRPLLQRFKNFSSGALAASNGPMHRSIVSAEIGRLSSKKQGIAERCSEPARSFLVIS